MSRGAQITTRWRQLIQKCLNDDTGPVSHFMQLATVTLDGDAAVRTVVFRGWHTTISTCGGGGGGGEEGVVRDALLTTTDTRSQKVAELRRHPFAEICWYFQEPRQQFRLTGTVTLVTSDTTEDATLLSLRARTWQSLSPSARKQFFYPPPGQPRVHHITTDSNRNSTSTRKSSTSSDRDKKDSSDPSFNAEAPNNTLPTSFALLVMYPIAVDFVDLRSNTRLQFVMREKDSTWYETEVNP